MPRCQNDRFPCCFTFDQFYSFLKIQTKSIVQRNARESLVLSSLCSKLGRLEVRNGSTIEVTLASHPNVHVTCVVIHNWWNALHKSRTVTTDKVYSSQASGNQNNPVSDGPFYLLERRVWAITEEIPAQQKKRKNLMRSKPKVKLHNSAGAAKGNKTVHKHKKEKDSSSEKLPNPQPPPPKKGPSLTNALFSK